MNKTLEARQQIYDHFHASRAMQSEFFRDERADDYAAYYTAMYLIQDTGEAVATHMQAGFSAGPMAAYIEFWGVMEALYVQQGAIRELHQVLTGTKFTAAQDSSWDSLLRLRNLSSGHPARLDRDGPLRRAFMGRKFGNYGVVTLEVWNAKDRTISHPRYPLGGLIHGYDGEAAEVLSSVLTYMRKTWPCQDQ